ncbi:hypothetical protein SAMN02745724_01407 [Pseudoalteromonas denitrificans DSM 6059]|uniref:Uncharacterized protein n=1 Tax=Pseudoalteromonas denitrificans DSM 6059 TaxID=1123010 RepID=A0A1I1ICL2_9GAMM|nr:hypothetical protein SAMN02745724_01407 [Pseudoalteromonas denitrificans DSM 6059]
MTVITLVDNINSKITYFEFLDSNYLIREFEFLDSGLLIIKIIESNLCPLEI